MFFFDKNLKQRLLAFTIVVSWYVKLSIICPVLLLFVLSCPAFFTNSSSYKSSPGFLSSIHMDYALNTSEANATLTQVLIQPNDGSNVLNKRFLVDCLAFLQHTIQEIDARQLVSFHSPFSLWNNNIDMLIADKRPIQTINEGWHQVSRNLLRGVTRINGQITSARGIAAMLMSPNLNVHASGPTAILDNSLSKLKAVSNITNYYVFNNYDIAEEIDGNEFVWRKQLMGIGHSGIGLFRFFLTPLTKFDYGWLFLAYAAVAIYFMYTVASFNHIKSRTGFILAAVCQITVVIGTAKTVTGFVFRLSPDNVPWFLFYIPVIVVFVSNINDLTNATNGASMSISNGELEVEENQYLEEAQRSKKIFVPPSAARLHKSFFESVSRSHCKAIYSSLLSLLLIALFQPFSRRFTFFLVTALVCNLFMNLTFFTALLSLDHRRFNVKDILFLKDDDENLNISLGDNKVKVSFAKWFSYFRRQNPIVGMLWFSRSIIILSIYMLFFNIRFGYVRSSTSLLYKFFKGGFSKVIYIDQRPSVIFDQDYVSREAIKSVFTAGYDGTKNILFTLAIKDPIFVVKDYHESENLYQEDFKEILKLFNSSAFSLYKFDGYYCFELILFLVLVASVSLFLLQQFTSKAENQSPVYPIPKLSGHDSLSLGSAFVDNKSSKRQLPNGKSAECLRGAFHTKELAAFGHTLDIMHIGTSQSPFIVSVAMDHKVLVWSPLAKPLPKPMLIPLERKFWPITKVTISNNGNYIAFFNKFGRITCWSRCSMDFLWAIKLDPDFIPLEAFFRVRTRPIFKKRRMMRGADESTFANNNSPGSIPCRTAPMSRQNSVKSINSISANTPCVDSSYESRAHVSFGSSSPESDEFIFVTNTGYIHIVNSEGNVKVEKLTSSDTLLKASKILISPRVNDRIVSCDKTGEIYVSTVINNTWKTRKLSVNRSAFNGITPHKLKYGYSLVKTLDSYSGQLLAPLPFVTSAEHDADTMLLLVPFVGFIARTRGNKIELIDAQSGTFIKEFQIGDFKPETLKIFHDQPTHCRFCGSASVASFSIAYTERDDSTLVLHTFQLDSKTKNSICLRVERDPREVRCLGLESVTEKKHYLLNIDGWDVSDNNMVIGIRRTQNTIQSAVPGSTAMCRSHSEASTNIRMQKRRGVTNKEKELSNNAKKAFAIHNLWEGWTMNINGNVVFHEIPVGVNGLLVNRIGPMQKFGAKSIVVAFGNIMKLFYLGKEELILTMDGTGSNEENTGLRYVNKRRDRLNRKGFVSPNSYRYVPEGEEQK